MEAAPAPVVRSRRFRLHVRGFVFAGLTVAIGIAGVARGNNHFFAIFSALAAILGTAIVLTRLSTRGLEFRREMPELAEAHRPFEIRLHVRNRRRLLPILALRVEDRMAHDGRPASVQPPPLLLPRIPAGGRARAAIPVTAFQRGRAAFGPLLVTAEFPPGLCSVEMVVDLPGSVLVLPRDAVLSRRVSEPLLSGTPRVAATLAAPAAGAEDFAGVREFREGDNPRWIHWKLSGRVPGRHYLREFEAPRAREAWILMDTCIPVPTDLKRRSRLERAASFAAALAEALLERRYVVRFRAAVPEPAEIVLEPGSGSVATLRAALALMKPTRTLRVESLLHGDGPPEDAAVFVLPLDEGEESPAGRFVRIPASELRRYMYYTA